MTQSSALTRADRKIGKILSVSPFAEDHVALEAALKDIGTTYSNSTWGISPVSTLSSALKALRNEEFPVAVCERDLPLGTWKDLIENTRWLPNPPLVIVTSRLADEHLWAEALNFGAYDVLAKPFSLAEVSRVITLACLRWCHGRELANRPEVARKPGTAATLAERWRAAGC